MNTTKRLSFRPRPLDIHKKLSLVTCGENFDGGVFARGSSSNVAVIKLDGEPIESNQVSASPAKKGVGGSDIPTPQFLVVDSYEKNYTPTFLRPQSYIRARPARSESAQYCEYDLEDDDEHWLNKLNAKRSILPAEKFEMMLYKLEITDHHKRLLRDKDRLRPVGPAYGIPTPTVLSQKDAIEVLKGLSKSITVLRAVFDYWKGKRESLQKPILRRLQPAPPVNDSSPFNVFRPSEKTHRPHTRRMQRREQSFQKLRKIRNHFDKTKQIIRLINQREKIKRELVQVESNIQRLEMSFKVGQDAQHDAVRMEDENGSPMPSRISGVEDGHHLVFGIDHPNGNGRQISTSELTPPGYHATAVGVEREVRRSPRFPSTRSRWKGGTKAWENLEPTFLSTKPLDVGKLESAGIEFAVDHYRPLLLRLPGRHGRGGRLVFDRWNPLNQSPVGVLNHHFASKPFATPVDRDQSTCSPTWSSTLSTRWQLQRA